MYAYKNYIYIYIYIYIIFSLTPRPVSSKSVILKNDLLLVFQKRRRGLDTTSKCQYDYEVRRQKKTVILMMP